VPNLWDNRPKGPPEADLNPLTNPVLERNLSRWAKVYFSHPPGKREQAVSKLLDEIKKETAGNLATGWPNREDFLQSTPAQESVCPNCQHNNPSGHKFCGRCGMALTSTTVGSDRSSAPTAADPLLIHHEGDVPWLRARTLSAANEPSSPARQVWKYLAGGLAIALAVFAYVQWTPKPVSNVAAPDKTMKRQASVPAPSAVENSPLTNAGPRNGEVSGRPERPGKSEIPPSPREQRRTPLPGIEAASEKSPLPDALPSRQSVEGGIADLHLAQRFLGGETGIRDSAEAAKLLWKAVRKQNGTAAILLSDLYVRGDGVPRSCDQARLLLLASARRGVPQAIQQLQGLPSHGCQ
jgi:hypothetical protein